MSHLVWNWQGGCVPTNAYGLLVIVAIPLVPTLLAYLYFNWRK